MKRSIQIMVDRDRNILKLVPRYIERRQEGEEHDDPEAFADIQAQPLESTRLTTKLTLTETNDEKNKEPNSTTSISSTRTRRSNPVREEPEEQEPDSTTSIRREEVHEL